MKYLTEEQANLAYMMVMENGWRPPSKGEPSCSCHLNAPCSSCELDGDYFDEWCEENEVQIVVKGEPVLTSEGLQNAMKLMSDQFPEKGIALIGNEAPLPEPTRAEKRRMKREIEKLKNPPKYGPVIIYTEYREQIEGGKNVKFKKYYTAITNIKQ